MHPAEGCYPDDEPGERPYNRHGYFNERNRNKLGICLDLRHPRGRRAFLRLAAVSDVVVENFSAGTMDCLGLGYRRLRRARPDIIMLSMPAFGCTGPESHYLGYGATNDQMSGLVSVTGYEEDGGPQNIGINSSDPLAGQHGAAAVLAALYHRRRTGRGQFIDLSHRESACRLMAGPLMDYRGNGRIAGPRGNRPTHASPQGLYPCRPGESAARGGEERWLAIAVETDEEWAGLCRLMGRPELAGDPRYADVVSRWRNRAALDELVAAWTRESPAGEAMEALQAAGVPAGVAHTGETLFTDPQLRFLDFFWRIEHTESGSHEYLGVAWHLSRSPGRLQRPAPCLGEHSEEVLRDIARLAHSDLEALRRLGLTGEGAASPPPPQ